MKARLDVLVLIAASAVILALLARHRAAQLHPAACLRRPCHLSPRRPRRPRRLAVGGTG